MTQRNVSEFPNGISKTNFVLGR